MVIVVVALAVPAPLAIQALHPYKPESKTWVVEAGTIASYSLFWRLVVPYCPPFMPGENLISTGSALVVTTLDLQSAPLVLAVTAVVVANITTTEFCPIEIVLLVANLNARPAGACPSCSVGRLNRETKPTMARTNTVPPTSNLFISLFIVVISPKERYKYRTNHAADR